MSTIKTELKKTELFAKEVLAKLKGDGNEALANKIARKAISAFEGQIAALKAKEVDDENTVEDAQEAFANAIYPTSMFSDNKSYCQNIVFHQQLLDAANDILQQTKDSITFFEGLLNSI